MIPQADVVDGDAAQRRLRFEDERLGRRVERHLSREPVRRLEIRHRRRHPPHEDGVAGVAAAVDAETSVGPGGRRHGEDERQAPTDVRRSVDFGRQRRREQAAGVATPPPLDVDVTT